MMEENGSKMKVSYRSVPGLQPFIVSEVKCWLQWTLAVVQGDCVRVDGCEIPLDYKDRKSTQ